LDAGWRAALRPIIDDVQATFQVPGMGIAVARGEGSAELLFVGTDGKGQPLDPATLFPVASITKLATALSVLRLADLGLLAIDNPVGSYLPDATGVPDVPVRQLLCHLSGLPVDLAGADAGYTAELTWPRLAAACLTESPTIPPNTRVQYSNVGYGVLAVLVARRTGREFARALRSFVLEPLGVDGYLGVEPPQPAAVLAGVRSKHVGTPLEPYNTPFWRSLALPWGGLLTTVEGALRLVRAFRGQPPGFLSPALRADSTRNQTGALAGGFIPPLVWRHSPWGLGPELRDAKSPHWAPAEASPDSFGHSGASGCVAWVDPNADVAWAILGARTADNGWLVHRGPALGRAILATLGR
jgi:CubicO group peptidase (beta-lactamase class C family)